MLKEVIIASKNSLRIFRMARPRKYVDEHYFDHESKAMQYVLGTFYACYTPISENGIKFTSSRDLVKIVMGDQLESEHSIITSSRTQDSYWVEIRDVHYFRSQIGNFGLDRPKLERDFPKNIKRWYVGHFVRGFLDGKGSLGLIKGRYLSLTINYNNPFLLGLHKVLAKYAGVRREAPKVNRITYGHQDCLRIYEFIYGDWPFIYKNGLYLESKKGLFDNGIPSEERVHGHTLAARAKITKAKKMLIKGITPTEIAQRLDYSYLSGLYRTFKIVEGTTLSQWRKKNNC